jgi:hypothetical protein
MDSASLLRWIGRNASAPVINTPERNSAGCLQCAFLGIFFMSSKGYPCPVANKYNYILQLIANVAPCDKQARGAAIAHQDSVLERPYTFLRHLASKQQNAQSDLAITPKANPTHIESALRFTRPSA